MALRKEVNAEPIPGYRLIEPLGSGAFGQVWKCEAPGGIFKAIKFVYGDLNGLDGNSVRANEELRAIQHIKSIRHPFLLSIDRVESVGGELIIVTELADLNLDQLLQQYLKAGKPGIPRDKLLGYLREAAEVLDLMHQKFQLQHLDIKPRNLFLVSHHVKVADFGLVSNVAGGSTERLHLGAITPVYAAPELFLGKISQFCDQYSLAITYQELLTGTLPFSGVNCRQLLYQHTKEKPNIDALPPGDREIVGRALTKDSDERYASCMDFIHALMGEAPAKATPEPVSPPVTIRHTTEDTQRLPSVRDTMRIDQPKKPPLPPTVLRDYVFQDCVGSGPLADHWRVLSPDGRTQLVKFIYGFSGGKGLQDTVKRLKCIHHPALTESTIVHVEPGRLILVTDPVKQHLRDRAQECQARKFPGVMRGELLDYLRVVAESLDYLYQQHSIQHLNLNPRNLILLEDGRVQIAEFGLAQLLWLPAQQPVAQCNSRYAAPELFDSVVAHSSDQFSLALIYMEMLTGAHPFRGMRSTRDSKPNFQGLPEFDRAAVARALDIDPKRRWPSCLDFVRALEGTTTEQENALREAPDRFTEMVTAVKPRIVSSPKGVTKGNLNEIIADLIISAGGVSNKEHTQEAPTLSENQEELRHRFHAGLPLGSARLKLDSFAQQWYAQLIREDEQTFVFHISLPTNFWQQWIGRHPGLEVQVHLARVHALAATPIEVSIALRTFRCGKKHGAQLLEEMGPLLLESIRDHLLINSEKRLQDRLLWPHPLKVYPLHPDGEKGDAVDCRGKDISQSGIGFYLPHELETSEVLIELPSDLHPPAIRIPASLVRVLRCTDGWYEVGALFRIPALRKSMPSLTVASASR